MLLWQYDEAIVTQEEYAPYDTLATELIQEQLNALEASQEKKNVEMQANIEYLAMMTGTDLEG